MRSRLSPRGGQNQKCHFEAKTDTFFINSFIYRAYYVKSYKKLDQKAQNLDITSFTIRLRPKWRDFTRNLHFFSKRNMFVIFTSKDQFSIDQLKGEIKMFLNMYDTWGWGAIFPLIYAVKVK